MTEGRVATAIGTEAHPITKKGWQPNHLVGRAPPAAPDAGQAARCCVPRKAALSDNQTVKNNAGINVPPINA
jgi:hypothetical protein